MCIDLFWSKSPTSFQKSTVVETDLSDFHKLIVTVITSYSPKRTPNIFTYRKYTNFDKDKFIDEISFNIPKHNLQELTPNPFIRLFKIVFEKHAPLKKKCLGAAHSKLVSIDISNLTDSNKFWKTVKPIADSKTKSKKSINLV